MAQPEKRGRGCLLYLGIVAALAVVVAVASGWLGTRYAKRIVNNFTFTRPISITNASLSADEQARVNERIYQFGAALRLGKGAEPLELSIPEVNALIGTETNLLHLRDHFAIASFSSGQISGLMSFPAEQLGLEPLRGRFINATGTFTIEVRSNQIQFNAASLSTPGGKPFAVKFEEAIRMRNLAAELNSISDITNALSHIQSIGVSNGFLMVVPRK